ncbi:Transcriptional regulator OS=Streptomyces antimycoticus OX=68175 GN=SANT12839_065160 PE=4 SV=1 [Streptomyces antimycoticus]
MDTTAELGEFSAHPPRRAAPRGRRPGRVRDPAPRPGPRREELAQLAGVSVAYYTRLEQGQSTGASDGVLDAIARALRLSPDERAHLSNLALSTARRAPSRAARRLRAPGDPAADRRDGRGTRRGPRPPLRRPGVESAGHALIAGHLPADAPERPAARPNTQRMLFLDPHTRELYPDWPGEARRAVSSLRVAAGAHPDDRRLAELVGELSMKCAEFAALWSRHPVRRYAFGTKSFHHPLVGPLELDFEMTRLPDSGGHGLLMYGAEPGSPSEAALRLLAREAVTFYAP